MCVCGPLFSKEMMLQSERMGLCNINKTRHSDPKKTHWPAAVCPQRLQKGRENTEGFIS